MIPEINITLAGDADSKLARLDRATTDSSEFWPTLGSWWAKRERSVFQSHGFGRWAPLRASTILERRSIGLNSDSPLIRTGTLLDTVSTSRPVKTGPKFAVFGSHGGSGEAAGLHVRAGEHGPARNPVPALRAAEKKEVLTMLSEWLRRART